MPQVQANDVGRGSGELVLIVEDNEKNARLLTTMIESAGYRTCWAADGEQGLDLARERLPALIVTDLQMPRLDGVGMTRALKADENTASIPVIAVSAHALGSHGHDALAAGCCKFIAKPFRFQQLLDEVGDALRSPVS